eukprot:TRINITY_DN6856_c0_g1_i1.p1 TRINITY_DN6856_c0_g1~~TRINITY_DN6856_c0_g1_i1.p1  ORF type:complete len:363 (-),score=31.23 TRINITY_DN6856_c0_g1_i1:62-1150(-)
MRLLFFLVVLVHLLPTLILSKSFCTYLYLSPSGDDQTGNGTEQFPYRTLNQTLSVAIPGDTIIFDSGIYQGSSNLLNINISQITLMSANDTDPAVISCNYLDRHLSISILQGGLLISNLQFSGCYTMFTIYENQVHFLNCSFDNIGLSSSDGAIVLLNQSSAIIDSCTFKDTFTPVNINSLLNVSVTINDSNFDTNGAIITGTETSMKISDSFFLNCGKREGVEAGCIYNEGYLVVTNSVFKSSEAVLGGAIWSGGGTLSIVNSTFFENVASSNGGALFLVSTNTSVSRCCFVNNSASESGGAIEFSDTDFSAIDTLFLDNSAAKNGGDFGCVYNDSSIRLTNCTRSGNQPNSSCPVDIIAF